MKSIRRAGVSLAFLFALTAASAPAAPAQSPPSVGVGAHELDARSLSYLRELGVEYVRTTLYWAAWEDDPAYRRTTMAAIDGAVERGFRLLVVVHGNPARYGYRNRDQAFNDFARLMGDLARRFPGVEAWQLWNEMDVESFTDLFGARDGVPYPRRGRIYAAMLERAYPAIKAADRDALVVTGGIAAGVKTGFLEELLRSGAPFDAIGLHAYGFPAQEAVRVRGRELDEVLARANRTETPVWLTEFGLEQAVVPGDRDHSRAAIDRHHLDAWRNSILWNNETRTFDRMYGHVLKQGGDLSYDLVRRDGSLRPAGSWLRSYLH